MVIYLKFIGPFLRINSLKEQDISNQLFHLSKESLRHIVLESRCGIPVSPHALSKHISKIDINQIKSFSPLLCIYKKGSAKLTLENNTLTWNTNKFKKEICIFANALMTLSLLELSNYYKDFKDIDKKKFNLSDIYLALSKCQLEFYASYLRNLEGVFVNKIHSSDLLSEELKFEEKNCKFKFSDQALLMCAYYRYSTFFTEENDDIKDNYAKEYKNFSLDILNMFLNFRENIYEVSFIEKLKICAALNLFYFYSKNEDSKFLLLDTYDLILDEYNQNIVDLKKNKVLCDSLLLINSQFIYKNLNFLKAKEISDTLYTKLISMYDENLGLYQKDLDSKTIEYDCSELVCYLYSLLMYSSLFDNNEDIDILENLFKNSIINSGLVLSWPEVPPLNDTERYKNFSKKSDDLLDDQNFRMPTIPTPESNELASIFVKKISYNRKKSEFKQSKSSFDSNKNMLIFFMCIFYNNNLLKM